MLQGLGKSGFPTRSLLLRLEPLQFHPHAAGGDQLALTRPSNGAIPDWRQGGTILAVYAQRLGYPRGTKLTDKTVIRQILHEAAKLYGVPFRFLEVIATRESGMNHYQKDGSVKSAAAVGMFQVEKSAFPDAVTGPDSVFDLYNNIAFGARRLATAMKRLTKEANYQGQQPWQDLGPIAVLEYGSGIGTLRRAQQIARQMGRNPYNWKHLVYGTDGTESTKNSPMYQSLEYFGRKLKFPFAYHSKAHLKRFDLDGDGVAHRSETQLHRIQQVLGLRA